MVAEAHYAAEIDCGRHAAVTVALAEQARLHPLREGLQGLLMTALYRSGRTAEALAAYRSTRTTLTDELGLEPGPALQQLHAQILAGEARPAAPGTTAHPGPARTWMPPRRLPIAPAGFSGRTDHVTSLDALLTDAGGAGLLVALHGGGGVGKTSLALHWAHRVADQFPDGQLFANLRGHGPTAPRSPADVLATLLRSLGVEPDRLPVEQEDRATLFREMLVDRRLLIVLDNARDSTQLRPLLPGGEHTVVVTSRSQLRNLVTHDGARRVRVDPMSSAEAVQLLTRRLGSRRDGAPDTAQLSHLAALCGHLPIALAVAAERAERYDQLPLEELAAELHGGGAGADPLAALTAWEEDPATSVRAVLSWSYDALDPDAARQFRFLGLHPYPAFDVHVASWLAGTSVPAAAAVLDRLVEAHLLGEATPGVFEMHDLVRAFATHVAHGSPGEAERSATVRMRAGYLHTTAQARRQILRPHDWLDPGAPPAAVAPVQLATSEEAFSWVRDNQERLITVVAAAADSGDHAFVEAMVGQLDSLFKSVGSHELVMRLLAAGRRSADRSGSSRAKGTVHFCLGTALILQGRAKEALAETTRAVALLQESGTDPALMTALMCHAMALTHVGDPRAAFPPLRRARRLAAGIGRTAAVHNQLAHCHLLLGELDEALHEAEQAVAASPAEGEGPLAHALWLDTLGEVEVRRGEFQRAREYLARALADLGRTPGAASTRAETLKHLGLAQSGLGDSAGARESWQAALLVLEGARASDSTVVDRAEFNELIAGLPGDNSADR